MKMPYLYRGRTGRFGNRHRTFQLPRIETTRDFRPAQAKRRTASGVIRTCCWARSRSSSTSGAEVPIGSFLVNYFEQPDIGGLTSANRRETAIFYWGGAMVGRFIGSAVLARVRPNRALGVGGDCAPVPWCSISILSFGHFAMGASRSGALQLDHVPNDLHSGNRGAWAAHRRRFGNLLVAAIVGGAILPLSRETCGLDRHPSRLYYSGPLLYLHGLLRIQRIAADAFGPANLRFLRGAEPSGSRIIPGRAGPVRRAIDYCPLIEVVAPRPGLLCGSRFGVILSPS